MKTFLNLTNGLEALPCQYDGLVRIQSTACEQKRWREILEDLDYTFLMAAAVGPVMVVDAGKKGLTRAQWQGTSWIQYVLNRYWLGLDTKAYARGNHVTDYWREQYDLIINMPKNLVYVKQFVAVAVVLILTTPRITVNDGDYDYHIKMWREHGYDYCI